MGSQAARVGEGGHGLYFEGAEDVTRLTARSRLSYDPAAMKGVKGSTLVDTPLGRGTGLSKGVVRSNTRSGSTSGTKSSGVMGGNYAGMGMQLEHDSLGIGIGGGSVGVGEGSS